jgi:hypothetical protein
MCQVEDASVTALSWNCTGSVLAVGYQLLNNYEYFLSIFVCLIFIDMGDMTTMGGVFTVACFVHGVCLEEI